MGPPCLSSSRLFSADIGVNVEVVVVDVIYSCSSCSLRGWQSNRFIFTNKIVIFIKKFDGDIDDDMDMEDDDNGDDDLGIIISND
jgi:hypothetical protein